MKMRRTPRSVASYSDAAELLKSLAHPHRLLMVQMLLKDLYAVGELAHACKIPSHMASEHLRLMQRSGLLARKKEGRRVFYEVVEPPLAAVTRALCATLTGHPAQNVDLS